MSDEINQLNIPAYQRKRSLAAKARKSTKPKATTKRKTTRKTPVIKPHSRYDRNEMQEISISEIIHEHEREEFENPLDIFKGQSKKPEQEVREMKTCGICEGYFDKIDVAIIRVTSAIRTGDIIIFEKEGGLFEQEIKSMQIDRKDVSLARAGSDIGMKVFMPPKVGTTVYKVIS